MADHYNHPWHSGYKACTCLLPQHCCIVQEPGIEPGDVVFVLEEQDHGRFKRKGSDLITNMVSIQSVLWTVYHVVLCDQEIDLVESLCGFRRAITTLDKRSLLIISPPGDVMKHGKFMLYI